MPKPAFFVDGHMEALIVEKLGCGYVTRRIDTNGRDVAADAIAKKINLLYKTLNNKYFPIYVLIDLEGRKITANELRDELENCMAEQGLPVDQFRCHVCDRMIENWILADVELLSESFKNFKKKVYEGENGKSVFRSLFEKGRPYQETTDGVELFLKARASEIRLRSSSFNAFFNDLDPDCWWLKR